MRTLLYIPAHGQNIFFKKMLERLSALTERPAECIYTIDRPQPGEFEEAQSIYDEVAKVRDISFVSLQRSDDCPERVGHPQMNAGSEYFLTGYLRNKATQYALDNGFDAVVFIDGDCVPEPDLIAAHNAILNNDTPVSTIGRRREIIWNMEDQRMASPDSICHFFADTPTLIENEFWFVDSGVVWTCNFGLNIAAIKALRQLNSTLYGVDEVFSTEFLGTWGGEDGFVGMECYYSGIPTYALPNGENGIIHQPHTRPLNKYDHPTFIPYLEAMREDLLTRMRLNKIDTHAYIPRIQMKH